MRNTSPHISALIQQLIAPASLWEKLKGSRHEAAMLLEIGDSNDRRQLLTSCLSYSRGGPMSLPPRQPPFTVLLSNANGSARSAFLPADLPVAQNHLS
jgi:hypothetical protein